MMKLYETNDMFDKETYVACLAKINVPAQIVKNGVMIDIEAYKANYEGWKAPHMLMVNHRFVKQLY